MSQHDCDIDIPILVYFSLEKDNFILKIYMCHKEIVILRRKINTEVSKKTFNIINILPPQSNDMQIKRPVVRLWLFIS